LAEHLNQRALSINNLAVPLPLPPGADARALLHHLLEHGDIVGRDTAGRTVNQLAVDDWTLGSS
jgi:hypothetical protein